MKASCKGLFFRYEENDYWSKKRSKVVVATVLTLLKRDSCQGCHDCSWMLDALGEEDDLRDLVDTSGVRNNDKCKMVVRYASQDDYTLDLIPQY